jgi:hypothetical protein
MPLKTDKHLKTITQKNSLRDKKIEISIVLRANLFTN